jgi:hypothetical protein
MSTRWSARGARHAAALLAGQPPPRQAGRQAGRWAGGQAGRLAGWQAAAGRAGGAAGGGRAVDSGDADARAHLGTCVARWGRRRGARRTQRPLPAWPGRLSDWQQPPAVPAAHALHDRGRGATGW